MKQLDNISEVAGGVVTVYDHYDITTIALDSWRDECKLGGVDTPKGTFTMSGYTSSNGTYYSKYGGPIDIFNAETGLRYWIDIDYSWDSTRYTISYI